MKSISFTASYGQRPRRQISLLLAVVALHLAAIAWMTGRLAFPSPRSADPDSAGSISVALMTAAPPRPPAPMPPPKPRATAEEAKPPAESAAVPPPISSAAPDAVPSAGPAPAGTAAPAAGAEKPAQAGARPESGASSWKSWQGSPPPSARLVYGIRAQRQGQDMYGSGQIEWRNNGGSYVVEGESSLLFFTVFNFRSEGVIESHGIAPVLYNEKRFRRSETNTHFHRERNRVSFSASTRSYPRDGGEQDRSSVVWQLASLGRHGSQTFRPGVQFAIFVAGSRDGETWHFDVVGLEEIETELGRMKAWHLARKPRADSYEQGLDVWLAPEKEWYPVKLRHTDRNGEYLDMTVSEIGPASL